MQGYSQQYNYTTIQKAEKKLDWPSILRLHVIVLGYAYNQVSSECAKVSSDASKRL
jgi:hypothetical protein